MQKTVCFLRCIYRDDIIHHYCGYVGISDNDISVINNELLKTIDDESKELFIYDAIANKISVHGGVTFYSKICKTTPIIPISAIPENWADYTYYGFDLNHYGDDINGIAKSYEYAKNETIDMQKQLEALIERYSPSTGD